MPSSASRSRLRPGLTVEPGWLESVAVINSPETRNDSASTVIANGAESRVISSPASPGAPVATACWATSSLALASAQSERGTSEGT